ncbi:hypothetical protein Dimus_032837 [Dionaea muscipula]
MRETTVKTGCSDSFPEIVIIGESSGVEHLRQSCVIEWTSGSCEQGSSIISELGAEATTVKIDRGVSMTPWTEDMMMKLKREVWNRCLGIPLYSRSPNMFLSIGKHWGDVLMVEFSSVISGSLDDRRINILTEIAGTTMATPVVMLSSLGLVMLSPSVESDGVLAEGDTSLQVVLSEVACCDAFPDLLLIYDGDGHKEDQRRYFLQLSADGELDT